MVGDTLLFSEHLGKTQRVTDADATMAQLTLVLVEQRFCGRVVQIDCQAVLQVELDEAKRVAGPGPLNDPAVAPAHVVAPEIGCTFSGQFPPLDRFRHRPCGIGNEAEHGSGYLRRFLARLADDDVALIDQFAIAEIAQFSRRSIHVDACRRWLACEPAQSFHRHRNRPRMVARPHIENG